MFNNIGGKIKMLAQIVTWIGIIASVIVGIVMMFIGGAMAAIGVGIMVIGALASWISSFLLYGFGQLIQNTDRMVHAQGNCPPAMGTPHAPQKPKAPSKVEESAMLEKWRAQGLITEEEYQQKKNNL